MRKVLLCLFVGLFLVSSCASKPLPVTGIPEIVTPSADLQDSGPGVFLPLIQSPAANTPQPPPPPTGNGKWAMTAANPERNSWTETEVTGNLRVEWYLPVEAYISQNVQLIASDGMIFVSTSRGLYALNAVNGSLVWRFDTELPLGNSPTVADGVVYVGGFDRQIHALRVSDGRHLWSFDQAGAGFSTNPLVVDGRIFAGNRDGYMYAIGAHGTSRQGQLLWKYKTDGMIDVSAAYKDNVVYFASNDNRAYALRADSGQLVWRSEKMPGDGFQSYWPVVYGDLVIFSAASGYRNGINPGTFSLTDSTGANYGKIFDMERDALFAGLSDGALIGPTVSGQAWANGKTVLDVSRITEYLEDDPDANDLLHKPWRRVLIALHRSNGVEYGFDSDNDGHAEFLPAAMWGTHSGNRYPPIVGPDGLLYFSNIFQRFYIPQGKVVGWNPGTPDLMSLVGGQGAVDEPQAISVGGSTIYRTICCDRVGDYFSINTNRSGQLWSYHTPLSVAIPGYDVMWYGVEQGDSVRLIGNYGTQNGLYHNHGDQNPLIPYGGRLYVHRSNAIIAFGPGTGPRSLPVLEAGTPPSVTNVPTEQDLQARLESEIQKIVDAGHLRPGYYNAGQFSLFSNYASYFENPGDTLYTLSIALPYLSSGLQAEVRAYLQSEFQTYFEGGMYSRIGWANGAPRESMPIPDDIQPAMERMDKAVMPDGRSPWNYPPFNFYAMWKYAQVFPDQAGRAYDLARSKIQVPVPNTVNDTYLVDRPYEMNAAIVGYFGFLRLQEAAGRTSQDATLRTQVTNELNRLQNMRSNTFDKDTPWVDGYGNPHMRPFNVARNFLFMTPELGDYLNQTVRGEVEQALAEYNETAPYWFVTRYNGVMTEGVRQHLYDSPALLQAKAYILDQNHSELAKYLDVPAFERGDLFYIQNLVAVLQAP